MRVRLSSMPKETKGLASMSNNLKRIEDALSLQGYKIIDMTNKPYDDGMIVKVLDFVPVDNLKQGQKKVLRTVTPQVTYKSGIISHGEIEVAISSQDVKK